MVRERAGGGPPTTTEDDWTDLLRRIRDGECTPFLGAGACFGTLPLGSEIAQSWAEEYNYPFDDRNNLARVAQFLARKYGDWAFPKELIRTDFERRQPPAFARDDEPHGVLADLPLPLYITTNYDSFMSDALRSKGKNPMREICRWNRTPTVEAAPRVLDREYIPTPANPVVFHLHGHTGVPESMVLTEEDIIDFLVAAHDPRLLPPQVQSALVTTSLLFVGYALEDFTFRVLLRGIVKTRDMTFQLPRVDPNWPERVAALFGDDYSRWPRILWGTASEFASELRQRWRQFGEGC
jgi:hypothetical protein